MNLSQIATESYATAKEKGWWDESVVRSNDILHLLMLSELSEALEDYRAHKGVTEVWYENQTKPCGIPSEVADVIIRIGDLTGKEGLHYETFPDLGSTLPPPKSENQDNTIFLLGNLWDDQRTSDFDFTLMRAASRICFIHTFLKSLSSDQKAYAYWRTCSDLVDYFDRQGYDLRAMIREKMDFNKTRPIRHGNKKV